MASYILLSKAQNKSNDEKLLKYLKEGGLENTVLVRFEDEISSTPKYDACILYCGYERSPDEINIKINNILNEKATTLIIMETGASVDRKTKDFIRSICGEMASKPTASKNVLLINNIEDLKALNIVTFFKWITTEENGLKNVILRVESNAMENQKEDTTKEIKSGLERIMMNIQKIDLMPSESTICSPEQKVFLPVVALGHTSKKFDYTYGPMNSILYSLGIGVSSRKYNGLQFLYENHKSFSIHPGFAVIPPLQCLMHAIQGNVPNLYIDLSVVLHVEQYTEIVSPFPTSGTLVSQYKILDIMDKGKTGAIILLHADTFCKTSGLKVASNQFSILVLGKGGWGGTRTSSQTINVLPRPSSDPQCFVDQETSVDQASLYRLNGDLNPLHIDPESASSAGFNSPILHGLCTQGIAVSAVMNTFGKENPQNVRGIKMRFSKPVIPGQIIRTQMWKSQDDDQTIIFSCIIKETGDECAIGWVKLQSN